MSSWFLGVRQIALVVVIRPMYVLLSLRDDSVSFSTLLHVVQWHCLSTSVCEARQYLCDCRLPNLEACLLSMSEFLNSDPHRTVDPLPFFYSLSLSRSPAPLSGVPAQRPSFAPTAFHPPCTGLLREAPLCLTSEAMWSGSDCPQSSSPPPPRPLRLLLRLVGSRASPVARVPPSSASRLVIHHIAPFAAMAS